MMPRRLLAEFQHSTRVDLELELEWATTVHLWSELESQVHRVGDLFPAGFFEPGEGIAYPINRRPNRFSLRLNQIVGFRVPKRFLKQELVDGRAAAKSYLSLQPLAVEEVA